MIDQIHLDDADAKFAGYFCSGPMADGVEVENLRVLRLYALANPRDRCFQDVLFPFGLPEGIELRRSRNALYCRGTVGRIGRRWSRLAGGRPVAKTIGNTPARNI